MAGWPWVATLLRGLAALTAMRAIPRSLPPQRAAASRAPDAFELNGQLLALNPDVYTLWNYRRDCVLDREAGA